MGKGGYEELRNIVGRIKRVAQVEEKKKNTPFCAV